MFFLGRRRKTRKGVCILIDVVVGYFYFRFIDQFTSLFPSPVLDSPQVTIWSKSHVGVGEQMPFRGGIGFLLKNDHDPKKGGDIQKYWLVVTTWTLVIAFVLCPVRCVFFKYSLCCSILLAFNNAYLHLSANRFPDALGKLSIPLQTKFRRVKFCTKNPIKNLLINFNLWTGLFTNFLSPEDRLEKNRQPFLFWYLQQDTLIPWFDGKPSFPPETTFLKPIVYFYFMTKILS